VAAFAEKEVASCLARPGCPKAKADCLLRSRWNKDVKLVENDDCQLEPMTLTWLRGHGHHREVIIEGLVNEDLGEVKRAVGTLIVEVDEQVELVAD
jgi:hypothetical protein